MAYSKRVDLLSVLVGAVERIRIRDGGEAGVRGSVRSDRAPRPWRVGDRLSEADVGGMVSSYQAGMTARELAEHFKISKSSVKRLLRERGVRRRTPA